jgi:hypothetical protein
MTMVQTPDATRQAVLRLAGDYGRLVQQHQDLEAQRGVLEGMLRATYAAARAEIPPAFAACPAAETWEDLYAHLVRELGSAVLLGTLALPRPQDGSWPASWGGLPGIGASTRILPGGATPAPRRVRI